MQQAAAADYPALSERGLKECLIVAAGGGAVKTLQGQAAAANYPALSDRGLFESMLAATS
jgi:hypothetical protein